MQNNTQKIIQKLKLCPEREDRISFFISTVSYYKLLPYIDFVMRNQEVTTKINKQIEAKDNWDTVVFLYRYNIKLSSAIYPYIYLLETTLKTQINNVFCYTFGYEWYKTSSVLHRANKSSVNYLEKVMSDYLNEAQKPNVMDFVENNTTFGYWVAILESGNYWNSNDIKLNKMFSANGKKNPALISLKDVIKKLRSVKDLRNYISHHNQIIGCNIKGKAYSQLKLWDIYQNILNLFNLLGCDDVEWMIGDLQCQPSEHCAGNSFEILYKQFEYINQCEIKADKVIQTTSINQG